MRVHMVGLGRLGLPVALAIEAAGHEITGWDASKDRRADIERHDVPEAAHEPLLSDLLAESKLTLAPLESERTEPDVVLIAVQTPHRPEFEGATPLDRWPQDFDYAWLRDAVKETASAVRAKNWDPLIVVISTCLPGTFDRELRPIVASVPLRFAYHPLFIAMGSVIEDFRHPEFVLVGSDERDCPPELWDLYAPLYGPWSEPRRRVGHYPLFDTPPVRVMSITSAELTKVAYNAWLGYKLMLANGLAELSDKAGANVDDVLGTLKLATDRLVSTRYMDAGMGDGGGCHPRDVIALSRLAKDKGLSHDTFAVVTRAREEHARWLADIWCDEADRSGLPMYLLGREYKPESTLTTGSAARLVEHYARARGREPAVIGGFTDGCGPACWFLGVPHERFLKARPTGVLIDPWGVYPESDGLTIVRPGRRA